MDQENFWVLLSKKLSAEASPEELKEFEHFILEHPDWQYAIQNMEDLWKHRQPKDDMQAEDAYMLHLHRMNEKNILFGDASTAMPVITFKKRIKKWYWSAAAVLILVAGSFFTYYKLNTTKSSQAQPGVQLNEISTRSGSKSQVILADGSVVWLNAGSKISYNKDFGIAKREITLTGEAFFDITKNPEKPFIIHTSVIDIKVLGTQFNVKSYPSDKTTETSLIRGSVEVFVKNREGKIILKPNEKLVVYNEPEISRNKNLQQNETREKIPLFAIKQLNYQNNDTIAVETSWTHNKLSFKNELFADVAKKMERWYDVSFDFENKNKENLLMYGTFTTESLREALEALVFSFGFKYRIENNKVIIY